MRSMLLRFGTALVLLLLIAQTAMAATLEKGSSGSEVTRLQQALNALPQEETAANARQYVQEALRLLNDEEEVNGL